jgi:hypothetical protein
MYDFAKLYANENLDDTTAHDINPSDSERSENSFANIYKEFNNFDGQHKFYLNTDSVELSNAFLGDFGSKKGTGILCYNGDAAFAGIGLGQKADEYKLAKK